MIVCCVSRVCVVLSFVCEMVCDVLVVSCLSFALGVYALIMACCVAGCCVIGLSCVYVLLCLCCVRVGVLLWFECVPCV